MNAVAIGTLAARTAAVDTLELAQVMHDAAGIGALVLRYKPKLSQGRSVKVMDMHLR